MTKAIGMLTVQTSMALYCTILLKVYLDVFLVRKGGLGSVAGWLFFSIWQFCVDLKMIFFNPFINLGILLITVLVIGFGAYEGGYWKRCVFPIAFISVWMMLEGTVELAYVSVVGTEPSFAVLSVLPKAMLLPYVMGIKGLMRKYGGGRMPYTGTPYVIVAFLLIMLLYNAFFMLTINTASQNLLVWLLVATVALIALILSFYPVNLKLMEMVLIKRNAAIYIRQLKLYKRECEMEKEAAQEIREMRHNMKQQYEYLRVLALAGQKEELLKALEELIGESVGTAYLKSRTGNFVIDACINYLWEETDKMGIILNTNIKVPSAMKILDRDMSVLLGNGIDNALEASSYVVAGGREIRLHMTYEKGYLYIAMKNRYEGKIRQDEKDRLISRKKEPFHGIGLSSMERIAGKYHGYVTITWEGEWFCLETVLYENLLMENDK